MPDTSARINYEGQDTRHRGLQHAGWLRATQASSFPLAPHRHLHGYELCLIVAGEVSWWAEDTEYLLRPGDAYFVRPGEWHGGVHGLLGPAELYWGVFSLPGVRGAYGLSAEQAHTLAERFANQRQRSFVGGDRLRQSFATLRHALKTDDELAELRIRQAVLSVLLDGADAMRDHAAGRQGPSRPIQRVMDWVRENIDDPASVDDLAELAELSVSRFHERFVAETGFAPGDWRTRQRIARAKRLLTTTKQSVTQIAMACGFSTSQYFATAFGRLVGLTPSAYRAMDESHPATDA